MPCTFGIPEVELKYSVRLHGCVLKIMCKAAYQCIIAVVIT